MTLRTICKAAIFEQRFIRLRNTKTLEEFTEIFGKPYARMNVKKALADCRDPDSVFMYMTYRPCDVRLFIMQYDQKVKIGNKRNVEAVERAKTAIGSLIARHEAEAYKAGYIARPAASFNAREQSNG